MFGRSILLLAAVAKLVTAADESWLVREREDALANAVSAKDKVVLSTLMDKNFWVYWAVGSVAQSFHAKVSRED